jgi:hypothetical protein
MMAANLSDDLVAHAISFLLDYDEIGPEIAFTHGNLIKTSKTLLCVVTGHLHDYVRECTGGIWPRSPPRLINLLLTDALRLRIDGVSQRMALALGVPRDDLDEMDYGIKRLSSYPRIVVNVFPLRDVLFALSEYYDYEEYRVPIGVKSNARPRKRGLYAQEVARKRRRLELIERREQAVKARRAKMEAHPKWPLIRDVCSKVDVMGDYLAPRLSPSTSLSRVVKTAQRASILLENQDLHPFDVGNILRSEPDALVPVARACNTCNYQGCTNFLAQTCPFQRCGKHCEGCPRHS